MDKKHYENLKDQSYYELIMFTEKYFNKDVPMSIRIKAAKRQEWSVQK